MPAAARAQGLKRPLSHSNINVGVYLPRNKLCNILNILPYPPSCFLEKRTKLPTNSSNPIHFRTLQSIVFADVKKWKPDGKADANKSTAPVQGTSDPVTRTGLAQRTGKASASATSRTTNLTRSSSNLSRNGSASTISRSNSISGRAGLANRNVANKGLLGFL